MEKKIWLAPALVAYGSVQDLTQTHFPKEAGGSDGEMISTPSGLITMASCG